VLFNEALKDFKHLIKLDESLFEVNKSLIDWFIVMIGEGKCGTTELPVKKTFQKSNDNVPYIC